MKSNDLSAAIEHEKIKEDRGENLTKRVSDILLPKGKKIISIQFYSPSSKTLGEATDGTTTTPVKGQVIPEIRAVVNATHFVSGNLE